MSETTKRLLGETATTGAVGCGQVMPLGQITSSVPINQKRRTRGNMIRRLSGIDQKEK